MGPADRQHFFQLGKSACCVILKLTLYILTGMKVLILKLTHDGMLSTFITHLVSSSKSKNFSVHRSCPNGPH